MNWFHRWLHPHCPECKEDFLDSKICESCNILQIEIRELRKHNQQLMDALLDKVKDKEIETPKEIIVQQPFNSQLPWRARRQILESEARKEAKILKEKREEMAATPVVSVDKLESDLGLSETEKELKHG